MPSHNALDAVERCVPSTFFDTNREEALALIVHWVTCFCSLTERNLVHPPEMMFDTNGPFYPLIRNMYSRLMICNVFFDRNPARAGVQYPFVISPRVAERLDVFRCLGPMLKAVHICLRRKMKPDDLGTKEDDYLVRNMLR